MLLLSNKQVNLYMWEQAINLAVEEKLILMSVYCIPKFCSCGMEMIKTQSN